MKHDVDCVAFEGRRRFASGELHYIVSKAHKAGKAQEGAILIFDGATSELMDVDWGSSARESMLRIETAPRADEDPGELRRPGRPRLGVVAREVTLLPRHWEWLNVQPGGASVALRKLVDEARRVHRNTDRVRKAKEAAYRFMSAMAGNEAGFEEATRGLFAGDAVRFSEHTRNWPPDVRDHAAKLAARAFEEGVPIE